MSIHSVISKKSIVFIFWILTFDILKLEIAQHELVTECFRCGPSRVNHGNTSSHGVLLSAGVALIDPWLPKSRKHLCKFVLRITRTKIRNVSASKIFVSFDLQTQIKGFPVMSTKIDLFGTKSISIYHWLYRNRSQELHNSKYIGVFHSKNCPEIWNPDL